MQSPALKGGFKGNDVYKLNTMLTDRQKDRQTNRQTGRGR